MVFGGSGRQGGTMPVIKKPKVERWRKVIGFEGLYSVSNWGQVRREKEGRNTHAGRILKFYPTHDGYLCVGLFQLGKLYKRRVNILVAQAFCKNDAGPGAHAHHRNEITTCNWSTNIQWLTPKTHLSGEMGSCTVLTKNEVLEILNTHIPGTCRWKPGNTAELAAKYGVSAGTISGVVAGRRWKHLTPPKKPSTSVMLSGQEEMALCLDR
jgi:hypothetical protein